MLTIKEMRNEIDRIKKQILDELEFEQRMAVYKRMDQLLETTAVNVTKGGEVRYYLTKTASYNVVDNYLECLINAMYDVVGWCF